ncbi:Ig-like domain-containing protein [Rarobacter incanus]|nr:Ig-like domain-containing protein [Rarobacter incanus]
MKIEHAARDAGMSLIEVIVALTLIGMVATAAAMFFISGLTTTKKLQSDQVAATVANQALDAARAVSPQPAKTGDLSGILRGRAKSDVEAAFAANAADSSDLVKTDVWDPAGLAGTSDDWVPLNYTTNVANTTYDVTTLIGGCYRSATASTSAQQCLTSRTVATDVLIYRVRAVVKWTGKGCTDQTCTYRATTLIDPSQDVFWNTNLRPYPVDDKITVSAGDTTPTETSVIGNDDIVYQTGSDPVVLTGTNGGAKKGAVARKGDGIVSYLPTDDDYSGTDQFKYSLVDAQGKTSANSALVDVRILPTAIDDQFTAPVDETKSLEVIKNDKGTVNGQGLSKKLFISMSSTLDVITTIDSDNPNASLQAARDADKVELAKWGIETDGTKINFKAPASTALGKVVTFYYYLADIEGEGSDRVVYASVKPAAVRVTVGDCMNIGDQTVTITGDEMNDRTDLDINKLNDNKSNCIIAITKVTIPTGDGMGDTLKLGNTTYNPSNGDTRGTTVSYKPQNDKPFIVLIEYQMFSSNGVFSTGTKKIITLKVVPLAVDDEYTVNVGGEQRFRPKSNDLPGNLGATASVVKVSALSGSDCGALDPTGVNFQDNEIRFVAPNTPKTCSFTYKLVPSNSALAAYGLDSNVATVTFHVGYTALQSEVQNNNGTSDEFISRTPYGQMPKGSIGNWETEIVSKIQDKNPDTKWFVNLGKFTNGKFPITAVYKLASAKQLSVYSITSANDFHDRDPKSWKIYGATSAAAVNLAPTSNLWTEIDSQTGRSWDEYKSKRTFTVASPGAYRYYMLAVSETKGGGNEFQIADWTLEY